MSSREREGERVKIQLKKGSQKKKKEKALTYLVGAFIGTQNHRPNIDARP